jgi:hypothetical protein
VNVVPNVFGHRRRPEKSGDRNIWRTYAPAAKSPASGMIGLVTLPAEGSRSLMAAFDEIKAKILADPKAAARYYETKGEVEAVHRILTCLRSQRILGNGEVDEWVRVGFATAIEIIESGEWMVEGNVVDEEG